MKVYINDLSADGAFSSRDSVVDAFRSLVEISQRSDLISRSLYCTRALPLRPGFQTEAISYTIANLPRDERGAILSWVMRRGPFVDDERTEEVDDYFTYDGSEVTDQGLGEAARRIKKVSATASYSFVPGSARKFDVPLLTVVHGWSEHVIGTYDVPNLWTIEQLERAFRSSTPDPRNWGEMINLARTRFANLSIGDHSLEVLSGQPFSASVANGVIDLLAVLNEMKTHMLPDGGLSTQGEALRQKYFVGRLAWFSDESKENKRDFANEMTFPDPDDETAKITCFWHGKIQTPQYRVHFEWPLSDGSRALKIAYIGPKISKK